MSVFLCHNEYVPHIFATLSLFNYSVCRPRSLTKLSNNLADRMSSGRMLKYKTFARKLHAPESYNQCETFPENRHCQSAGYPQDCEIKNKGFKR